MKHKAIDTIVNALLYEGYALYPYRRTALKNQQRWNYGVVYPIGLEPLGMKTECLVRGDERAALSVEVRFLQLSEKDSWQEATQRSLVYESTGLHSFDFNGLQGDVLITMGSVQRRPVATAPGTDNNAALTLGAPIASTPRPTVPERQRVGHSSLSETVSTRSGSDGAPTALLKVTVEITNRTERAPSIDPLLQCLVSTHTILSVQNGEFISLIDPPEACREAVESCRNVGTWPVLVGRRPERDCMLSSPIILYDYPEIAAESPGDLFDGTEIDEILTLRILTLSDDEKAEIRRNGGREKELLERAEALTPEQLQKLHGVMRDVRAGLKPGDHVRLRPKPNGDVIDIVLAGRTAVVESIERDLENRTHVAVVLEDDPGKDLGLAQHAGHRFFFSPEEMERIT